MMHLRFRCLCNIAIMIVVAAIFKGCAAGEGADCLPLVEVKMTPDHVYAQVIVPAGQSADAAEGFLPYPANWAVIRGVQEDSLATLNTLIIADAMAKGSLIEVRPVALIKLDSAGSAVDIVVTVPVDTSLSTLQIDDFVDLLTEHEPVRHILQTWFVNHRGFGSFELVGWRDEAAANKQIRQ